MSSLASVRQSVLISMLGLALASCGGGGGGDDPAPPSLAGTVQFVPASTPPAIVVVPA